MLAPPARVPQRRVVAVVATESVWSAGLADAQCVPSRLVAAAVDPRRRRRRRAGGGRGPFTRHNHVLLPPTPSEDPTVMDNCCRFIVGLTLKLGH